MHGHLYSLELTGLW